MVSNMLNLCIESSSELVSSVTPKNQREIFNEIFRVFYLIELS